MCDFLGSSESVSGSDNRDIMDDGASQELTEENITEMKGQGASGKVLCTCMCMSPSLKFTCKKIAFCEVFMTCILYMYLDVVTDNPYQKVVQKLKA